MADMTGAAQALSLEEQLAMLERLYKTVLEQAASSQITNRALEMQLEASHVKNRELSADLDKLRASIATSSGRDVRNPQVQSMAHQQVEIAALRNQLKEEKAAVVSAQNKLKIVESRCAALQKRLQAAEKAKEEALLSAKKAYPTPPTSSSRPLPIARSVTSNEMSDGSFDTRTLPTGHHPFSTHRILPPSVPKALTEPSAAGVLLHKETKEVVCFLSECRRPGHYYENCYVYHGILPIAFHPRPDFIGKYQDLSLELNRAREESRRPQLAPTAHPAYVVPKGYDLDAKIRKEKLTWPEIKAQLQDIQKWSRERPAARRTRPA